MERPANFLRIVGVVKKLDNNYYGIGDGLGNFAFLTKSFIVGMHPTNPLMWQNTIFLLDNKYNIKWKQENAQYFNSYDYQTKTIPIPEPIPAEFLDATTPQPRPMTGFTQPVPQQPAYQQPVPTQPPPMPQQPVQPSYQQPITQQPVPQQPVPPQDPLPQIITLLISIKQILTEQKALLNAICTEIAYASVPNIADTMPPTNTPNSEDMKELFNNPVNPEKVDEVPTSNPPKKNVPKINW